MASKGCHVGRRDITIIKTGLKGDLFNHMYMDKGVTTGQYHGRSSHTSSGNSVQLGVSEVCARSVHSMKNKLEEEELCVQL